MTAVTDEDLDDLLPDDLLPAKGSAKPKIRSEKQLARIANAQAEAALVAEEARKNNEALAAAQRLAQIVNLHIAGYSLAQIGAQIGASEAEVDRMLTSDAQRYVRNQPSLRVYVRNYISERYTKLLETVWDTATDKNHKEMLEHQDRALRILDKMAKLHGAEAPVQSEVKVDAKPEAVERLVQAIANAQGLGYDADIFDIPPEDIHEAVVVSEEATEVSGNAVGEGDETFS